MNRAARAAIAEETDAIVAAGVYRAPSGSEVTIDKAIMAAVAASHVLEPEAVRALATTGGGRRLPVTLSKRDTLTATAAATAAGRRIGALNFASAKNPGGGWRGGSEAQEESLARASALVATLEAQPAFYAANRASGSALYRDAMLISPGVPVFRDAAGGLLERPYPVTFFTAPAPNRGALREPSLLAEVAPSLRRRMRATLQAAAAAGVDHLTLGAWGCGVFRNDPAEVAALWAEALQDGPAGGLTHGVEMAIFDASRDQAVWRAFERVFAAGG